MFLYFMLGELIHTVTARSSRGRGFGRLRIRAIAKSRPLSRHPPPPYTTRPSHSS